MWKMVQVLEKEVGLMGYGLMGEVFSLFAVHALLNMLPNKTPAPPSIKHHADMSIKD